MNVRAWLAAILGSTFLLYAGGLDAPLVVDDVWVAGPQNPYVAELRAPADYFTAHYWQGISASDAVYRPVTVWSYALVAHSLGALFGAELAQHLVNLALHLGAVWLVFRLALGLGTGAAAALAAAAAFALHAIHHEPVVMVVGRAELLAFTAGAAGLLLLARPGRPLARAAAMAGASLAWFVAFAAKESALSWPAFALVWWLARSASLGLPLWRATRGAWLVTLLVALPAAALFLYLRARMFAGLPYAPTVSWLSNPLAWEPAGPRFFTATLVQGLALLQQVLPHGLLIDYGPHSIGIQRSAFAPGYLVCGTLLLLLAVLCIASARRRPLLFAGLAALLGFAFPTSNLLLPIGTIFGERLCYAPSLGVALLVAAAVQRWPRRRELWIVLLLWLGWSAVLLLDRHADYRSNEHLHRVDAARNPASLKLQMDVAAFDTQHGAMELARQRIAAVTEREPRLPEGWIKLGALLIDLQRPTEGIAALRRALVTPFVREREDTPRIYHLIGLAQRRIGQGEEAWLTLREAQVRDPRNVAIVVDLLDAAVDGNLPQREVDVILATLQQLDPEHPAGYFHRGRQEARQQRWAGAELLLRQSLERWRSPDAPLQVVVALAEAIHAQGRRQEAIEMLEAFRNDPRLRPNQLQRVDQVLQRLPR